MQKIRKIQIKRKNPKIAERGRIEKYKNRKYRKMPKLEKSK
jgi:hypothetical protein